MINILLTVIACLIAIPIVFLVIQLLSAQRDPEPDSSGEPADLSRLAIIVPAHNEEVAIADTLHSLIRELPSSEQVIVVADNCTDETATIASGLGVIVIERNDEMARGKGYALKAGMDALSLQSNLPEYVVIVDADCRMKPGSINFLVQSCMNNGRRPAQALDLMKSKGQASIQLKIAEFAWIVKNKVRPLGLAKLGLPCQLMGTGMLIPFDLLQRLELGTNHIAEDMKLGIDCALNGFPPVFCPAALVESYFPETDSSHKVQRQRWEHGHLAVIFSDSLGLLLSAMYRRNKDLLAMAFDLLIPPLALLVLSLGLAMLLVLLFMWVLDTGTPAFYILLFVTVLFSAALMSSWYRFARSVLSFKDLLWIPVYILAKIPMYIGYWFRRQREWIRTDRN